MRIDQNLEKKKFQRFFSGFNERAKGEAVEAWRVTASWFLEASRRHSIARPATLSCPELCAAG
jgi:hypothetical protein